MKRTHGELKYSIWFFALLTAAVVVFTCVPIYQYSFLRGDSDYGVHNAIAAAWRNLDLNSVPERFSIALYYPLYHISVALLSLPLNSINSAGFVFLVLCNIAAAVLFRELMRFVVCKTCEGGCISSLQAYMTDFTAGLGILISSIFGPLTHDYVYLPQGSPNLWHSPTYMAMRPFGVAALLFFLRYLSNERTTKPFLNKNCVLFGGFLLLSALAKPSFALLFLFAAGCYTITLLIKDFKGQFRSTALPLAVAVAPTLILLAAQYLSLPAENSYNVISGLAPIDTILSWDNLRYTVAMLLVPMLVFVLYKGVRLFRIPAYFVSFFTALAGWGFWYCTIGGRYSLSNHAWGYCFASQLLIIISMACAITNLDGSRCKLCLCAVPLSVYVYEAYLGVDYILYIINGGYFAR